MKKVLMGVAIVSMMATAADAGGQPPEGYMGVPSQMDSWTPPKPGEYNPCERDSLSYACVVFNSGYRDDPNNQEIIRQDKAEWEAEKKTKREIEKRAKGMFDAHNKAIADAAIARAEEFADPEKLLRASYKHYLYVKDCHDVRSGYAVIYVSVPEMEEARGLMRGIEDALSPVVDAEAIWMNAVHTHQVTRDRNSYALNGPVRVIDFAAMQCQGMLKSLRVDARAAGVAMSTEKDF